MVSLAKMEAQLVLHEGLVLHPYPDSDKPPNWTLGVGYNVTARGLDFFQATIKRKLDWTPSLGTQPILISTAEAMRVLDADIGRIEQAILVRFPDYAKLNEVRQRVCVDLTFNIGYAVFHWNNTIAAIEARDWSAAAKLLYRTKWATQVDDGEGRNFGRADRLATMLLTGLDYTR